MLARPLRNFVAIQAITSKTYECTSIIKGGARFGNGDNFLRGTVLRRGPLVGQEVPDGAEVFYERQSAHPGQTEPFDAAIFGGTPGEKAYIIPVFPCALLTSDSIERERHARKVEIERFKSISKKRSLDPLERAKYEHHQFRLGILNIKRRGMSRGNAQNELGDQAVGSGVVAVIHKEESS